MLEIQKGDSIQFLDYTIKNSANNDGLVLFKDNGKLHETHLGNYGEGTKENVDSCKEYALLHFMIARPQHFSKNVVARMMGRRGLHHEWFTFKKVCDNEGITIPKEIQKSEDTNFIITFVPNA